MAATTQDTLAADSLHHVTEIKTDFISQFDLTPEAERWPLVRQWMKQCPLPFYKELRAKRPILVTPECTLVARFDDVTEVLKQPTVFTVDLYKPKMGKYLMTEDDTDMHNTEKEIMLSLLKREDLPHIRNYVAQAGNNILENADGRIELINQYGRMVPALMVQNIFGLDGIKPDKLIEWSYWNQYDAFRNQHFHETGDSATVHEKTRQANRMLGIYVAFLLLGKWWHMFRGKPKKDTVTRMLQDYYPKKSKFSLLRQGINAGGLLVGAVETTSEAVAHIFTQLVEHPKMLAKAIELAQQDETEAFDKICWEALRFKPIAPYIFRKASMDYTLGRGTERATTISQGSTVLNVIASAMFDPAAFDEPDQFNPERAYGQSFHFGFGSHECMGKTIGLIMIPEMVRQVLRRPGIKVVSPMEYLGKPFPEQYHFSWDR